MLWTCPMAVCHLILHNHKLHCASFCLKHSGRWFSELRRIWKMQGSIIGSEKDQVPVLCRSSSCLLSTKRSGKDRDPQSLPSLGALVWGGREVMPSISPMSPLALLQALAHFLTSACSVHRGIHLQVSCVLVCTVLYSAVLHGNNQIFILELCLESYEI